MVNKNKYHNGSQTNVFMWKNYELRLFYAIVL